MDKKLHYFIVSNILDPPQRITWAWSRNLEAWYNHRHTTTRTTKHIVQTHSFWR